MAERQSAISSPSSSFRSNESLAHQQRGTQAGGKKRYDIKEYGPVCQSGGGGLVAALIAERSEVLCAVSSSGATAVKHRILAAGRNSDYTGKSMAEIWDPVEQLGRVRPMHGFGMFVTSDQTDAEVGFSSQAYYVNAAQQIVACSRQDARFLNLLVMRRVFACYPSSSPPIQALRSRALSPIIPSVAAGGPRPPQLPSLKRVPS